MKFKYSLSPNYHHPLSTKQMMKDLMIALVFISICSLILQFNLYGMTGAIRAFLIMVVAVIGCVGTDFLYFKAVKITGNKMKAKVNENVPFITGLILALCLPLGDLSSNMILYVTLISAIIAELFGKLIYGGFGYNIFNPAAVGRAFALLAFGALLVVPQIDGLASATPLASLASSGGINAVKGSVTDFTSFLIGTHGGSIGETMVIPLIIAGIFLAYRRVIDWVLPVVAVLFVGLLAFIIGSFDGHALNYVYVHMFAGGLMLGAVLMITDPVTNPISRQGKIIYAILFATITFLIRLFASLPEGVVFSILICNMFVPMIDKFTANVTDVNTGKKALSVAVVAIVCILLTILFKIAQG
ncbi:RnfABCDGE type electron transport complex subunit D [Mycoplasma sp. P36-A1]|uniref:RnfABCDGE type electron transport complex subunit D n=1 Tax=Mycoplasma sp. P36-A1 TaxID=3252900 RepID=UPI003C2EFDD0